MSKVKETFGKIFASKITQIAGVIGTIVALSGTITALSTTIIREQLRGCNNELSKCLNGNIDYDLAGELNYLRLYISFTTSIDNYAKDASENNKDMLTGSQNAFVTFVYNYKEQQLNKKGIDKNTQSFVSRMCGNKISFGSDSEYTLPNEIVIDVREKLGMIKND